MQILNSDGSAAAAVATVQDALLIISCESLSKIGLPSKLDAGILNSWRASENPCHIAVDMGPVYLDWEAVPLATKVNTLTVNLGPPAPVPAVCLSVGNPHAVIFVDDVEVIDLGVIGPQLENHQLFPDRANISFVNQIAPNKFRMRVWERGGGITFACGSGACAVGVAVHRSGRGSRRNEIIMDGGSVFIDWQDDGTVGGRVIMSGPVAYAFDGILSDSLGGLLRNSI